MVSRNYSYLMIIIITTTIIIETIQTTALLISAIIFIMETWCKKLTNWDAGLTTITLSRLLTMHLNDSNSIALHLKTHSIPKSKFQKILVENTTIIAQRNL